MRLSILTGAANIRIFNQEVGHRFYPMKSISPRLTPHIVFDTVLFERDPVVVAMSLEVLDRDRMTGEPLAN